MERGFPDKESKRLANSFSGTKKHLLPVSENHEHHFIECVKSRGTTVGPIDDAVRSDSIGHLSEIAVRTGRKITWDPVKKKIIGDPDAERYLSRTKRVPFGI